jgi:hypothetical protein
VASQLDIANRALLSIGARSQVSSIQPSDGSVEANAIGVLFTPTFEALGRTAHWNCLRKQIILTLLAAAPNTPENPNGNPPFPPQPWQYMYALPSDCLFFRVILPTAPPQAQSIPQTTYNNAAPTIIPGQQQIPFAVAYATDSYGNPIQVILTNQESAQGIYTVNQPNPAIWDSQFQAAMVAALAAYLVPALSLNLPLMQGAIQSAERFIAQARASDGNEGVTSMDHTPDWLRARRGGGGSGIEPYQLSGTYGGYCAMPWP